MLFHLLSLICSLGVVEGSQQEIEPIALKEPIEQVLVINSKTIQLQDIEEILFKGEGTFFIAQGDKNQLVLQGDEETLQDTSVDLTGLLLQIRTKKELLDYFRTKPSNLTCTLMVKDLHKITLEGDPYVKIDSFKTKNLKIVIRDSAKVDVNVQVDKLTTHIMRSGQAFINGKVIEQYVFLEGSSIYQAGNLESQACEVDIYGAGVAYVRASTILDVSLHGSGQVHYLGNPLRLVKKISGSGQLFKD